MLLSVILVNFLVLMVTQSHGKITVFRKEKDQFHVEGNNNKRSCTSYNAKEKGVFCECSKDDAETLARVSSDIACTSVEQECSLEFEDALIQPGMKAELDSKCHNCNNIGSVFVMNITESFSGGSRSFQGSWIDITSDAKFNDLYDKKSRILDVSMLDDKWNGHLVKVGFNGNQCAVFKVHGRITYPLESNAVDVLFGRVVSTATTTTTTPMTTTATPTTTPTTTPVTTTTPTTTPTTTLVTTTATSAAPTTTPSTPMIASTTLSTTTLPKETTSSSLKQPTEVVLPIKTKACEEEGLPGWVSAVFGILFVIIAILSFLLVWLCRKRSKEDIGTEIPMLEKNFHLGVAHSLSSSHLLPPDGCSKIPDIPSSYSTPVDERKKLYPSKHSSTGSDIVNQGFQNSIQNPQYDAVYLSPIDQPAKPQYTGEVYSPLSDYPSNIYAESTLTGDKGNLVYVELLPEEECLSQNNKNNDVLIYAELEKEEGTLTESGRTNDDVYSPLGDYKEDIYAG